MATPTATHGLVLSLFPGIGLLDRAFQEEGFCVVRGPDVLWGGDIRTFSPPAGRFEGMIGGPPCQAFSSLANLVRARGCEPRFGNLIPEFERVVREGAPRWFLMENVRQAPVPTIDEYVVHSFTFDNAALGEEQERVRRFSFGVRRDCCTAAPDLRRWIELAPLMLPGRADGVTQSHIDSASKGRTPAVTSTDGGGARTIRQRTVVWNPAPGQRCRRQSVTSRADAVPVAIGGSGKRKPGARVPAVTGAHSGSHRPRGGHLVVYQWQEMLRLQGLPPEFLREAPFTVEGKRKAVANGVPLPMGRAIARAVRLAVALSVDVDGGLA